jgi:hypothetical protein
LHSRPVCDVRGPGEQRELWPSQQVGNARWWPDGPAIECFSEKVSLRLSRQQATRIRSSMLKPET